MNFIKMSTHIDQEERQISFIEPSNLEQQQLEQSIAFLSAVAQIGSVVMTRLQQESQKVSMMVDTSEHHHVSNKTSKL
jgi:hypothetical protein